MSSVGVDVKCVECRVQGVDLKVWGSGFGVWGSGVTLAKIVTLYLQIQEIRDIFQEQMLAKLDVGRYNFSKVSPPLILPYKMAIELTFENFHQFPRRPQPSPNPLCLVPPWSRSFR